MQFHLCHVLSGNTASPTFALYRVSIKEHTSRVLWNSNIQQNALFCPTGFRIPDYKTYIKITIYSSPSLLSFSILSLLFLTLSSISLPSSLHISPPSLLFLSHISPHVFDLLTVLASPPAPSLSLLLPSHSCSLSPRPHLCNPLSFSSLTRTLSPPYCTSILLVSLFSLTFLCFCPSIFLFTFSLYIFSPSRLLILSFF
jgi:hypothetical protein